jgi:hypothetical protein
MRSQFTSLIQTLASLVDDDASAESPDEQDTAAIELEIDGCEIILMHPTHDAPRVRALCRFGPAPDDAIPEALYRLLEINLALADTGSGTLGVDGESRDVVFCFTADLAATSAQAMLRALTHAAEQAARWRADGFVRSDQAAWALPAENFDSVA